MQSQSHCAGKRRIAAIRYESLFRYHILWIKFFKVLRIIVEIRQKMLQIELIVNNLWITVLHISGMHVFTQKFVDNFGG